MPALRIETASFGYGQAPILRDISLHVVPGEVVAVVGPNAVGKSTLVRAASGALTLMRGGVFVGAKDIGRLTPAARARLVSVVPQAVQLPPNYTAMEVVLMGRTAYLGWFESEAEGDHNLALSALERTGTTDLADRPVGELSGGEQQRVLIGRAIAQAAPVMLLDEPTAHLDLRHQDAVLSLVRGLAKDDGLAVLIAVHDLNLVARFADRVALLSDGRMRSIGPPEEVLTPDELAAVYGIEIHVTRHPIHGTPLVLS